MVRISDCLLCFKFFFRFLGNSRFLAYILLYNKASAHKNAAERMDGVGDARQELVFIGMNMDESALRARLGSALLTDEEMAEGPGEWRHYSDPFAPWVAA